MAKMNAATLLMLLQATSTSSFVLQSTSTRQPFGIRPNRCVSARISKRVVLFSTDTDDSVASMRVGEIKKELESYGVSTKSFFEKSELVDALTKARADGMTSKEQPSAASSSTSSPSSTSTSSTPSSSKPRDERLNEEMELCKPMKATELKKELEERGISTKSFFEKSEFVKAVAEARVDNVHKGGNTSGGNDDSEGYAEYANVEVLTSDDAGPRKKSSEQQQQQQPSGGGGNPFGGGGMPGGMGGIGEMLKNMGGMGGGAGAGAAGAANPFGGGGGGANPFEGMGGMGGMGKVQEMMKNPKVMKIMQKAQSNPKVMAAVTECMSNPAAFAKYQNDPEIGGLLNELKQLM